MLQFWTGINYKETFNKIKLLDKAAQYSSFVKVLDLTRPYFVKCNYPAQKRYFFRVRAHLEGDGNYFFKNISEISFRHDFFNIHKFGRCNSPFESLFYCSSNPLLSLAEVIQMTKSEEKKISFTILQVYGNKKNH